MKGGNSGIQYRSKHLKDKPGFVVSGYQADMDADNSHTGILYEEKARGILAQRGEKIVIAANGDRFVVGLTADPAKLLHDINSDGWNEYVIVANGNKLTHTINGGQMIEVVDHQADKRAMDGIIALQLHRGFSDGGRVPGHQIEEVASREDPHAGRHAHPARSEEVPPGPKPERGWPKPPDPKPACSGDRGDRSRAAAGEGGHEVDLARLGRIRTNPCTFAANSPCRARRRGPPHATGDDRRDSTVYLDGKEVASTTQWTKPAFQDVTAALGSEVECTAQGWPARPRGQRDQPFRQGGRSHPACDRFGQRRVSGDCQ